MTVPLVLRAVSHLPLLRLTLTNSSLLSMYFLFSSPHRRLLTAVYPPSVLSCFALSTHRCPLFINSPFPLIYVLIVICYLPLHSPHRFPSLPTVSQLPSLSPPSSQFPFSSQTSLPSSNPFRNSPHCCPPSFNTPCLHPFPSPSFNYPSPLKNSPSSPSFT